MQQQTGDSDTKRKEEGKLIFPISYFQGISEWKSLLKGVDSEFKQLIGDTCIMLAMKKGSRIGNMAVKNKQLSLKHTINHYVTLIMCTLS